MSKEYDGQTAAITTARECRPSGQYDHGQGNEGKALRTPKSQRGYRRAVGHRITATVGMSGEYRDE